MQPVASEELGNGITCIDAGYIKPGLASFYLMQEGQECAVIETGTVHSVAALDAFFAQHDVQPTQVRYVIPTHVHLDHAGGAGLMMQRCPEARCLVHPRGARHLVDPTKLVAGTRAVYGDARFEQLYGEIVPVPAERIDETPDGHTVFLGDRKLELRHTPGHADHHYCVWDERSRGWFTGDVFGISYHWFRTPGGDYAMPSTTPTQFRPDALQESLALLDAFDPARMFLTHYGELSYSRDQMKLLQEQLDVYLDIADEARGDPVVIEERIVEYSLALVQAMNPERDVEQMRDSFRHDAHLNAQGLAVWYARSAE
jgi:glyoxylase-like metal-dependent hydrolase (beta-lactamase superfamily II)